MLCFEDKKGNGHGEQKEEDDKIQRDSTFHTCEISSQSKCTATTLFDPFFQHVQVTSA